MSAACSCTPVAFKILLNRTVKSSTKVAYFVVETVRPSPD